MLFRSAHGLQSTGSVVVAHGLSCSTACGIFLDQGFNPCPLHWQVDSSPLCHQGSPLLLLLFNIILEVLATAIRQEKEKKDIPIGKERLKLLLFTDDMILYIGNPKDTTKKLLELINELAAGYKISTQNYVVFI